MRCNSYLCSSINKVFLAPSFFQDFSLFFDVLKFKYDMPMCSFFCHLSCLTISEIPEAVVCCLTLFWRNSQSLSFQLFLMFLSFFSFFIFPLQVCYTFYSFPTFFYVLCCFFFSHFFSLRISVLKVSIVISFSLVILPPAMSSLLLNP